MTTTNNRQPTYRLYTVSGERKNERWTEIGAAWPNRDGKGFSINLDALPLGGRLVLREIEIQPEAQSSTEHGGQP
jgi:hypothetical protein